MMKKGWVKEQNSKKGFEKNEDACSSEGVSLLLDSTASEYLQLACLALPD